MCTLWNHINNNEYFVFKFSPVTRWKCKTRKDPIKSTLIFFWIKFISPPTMLLRLIPPHGRNTLKQEGTEQGRSGCLGWVGALMAPISAPIFSCAPPLKTCIKKKNLKFKCILTYHISHLTIITNHTIIKSGGKILVFN